MGAVFSLELVQSDWDSFNNWKNTNQLTMVGTSDSAKTDYQKVAYQRPLILLMGSERHGLSEQMQSDCDHMVFIPMEGRTDSLNLAVATGILLYEIYNQTRILESVKS
jgi:TrmH family RNA methyltransferase